MNFKDLTDKDIAYIKKVHSDKKLSWNDRMTKLMKYTGKTSERAVRYWIAKLGFAEKEEVVSEEYEKAKKKKFNSKKKRFIISWAQNNTPLNENLMDNMEAYAKHINADIHVIAGRYKNPTSIFVDRDDEFWDERITKYLDANRHDIHQYLSILSDIKIQPTAVNPLNGLQSISAENSSIVGHPRAHMQYLPVLEGQPPKIMMSTGACTVPNYVDSKAGKQGEFHHTFGFVIAEIKDNNVFYVRQVTATTDGNFCDLFFDVRKVKGKSVVSKNDTVEAFILGDLHVGDHDPRVLEETFNIFKTLKPKEIFLHDVFDGKAISHHEAKDPILQYEKEISGKNSLKNEINEMLGVLDKFKQYKVTIVKSNHDVFVDRWIKDNDWRKSSTPKNALEYMEYAALLLSGKAKKGIIPYVINQKFPKFRTLDINDTVFIKGWNLGQHGHTGISGSRGSIQQYRRLNQKSVTGHSHVASRFDGALSVGTTTKLRVGYNNGPSAWGWSHVIVHHDSKAQHINFIEDSKGNIGYTTLK